MDQLTALVDREAPWQEMLDLVNAAAQWGFPHLNKIDATAVLRRAGDQASGVAYLIGNRNLL